MRHLSKFGAVNAFYVQGDLIALVFPSHRSMSAASLSLARLKASTASLIKLPLMGWCITKCLLAISVHTTKHVRCPPD
jgi:hypothetical protein